jgi:hypothetical protein
MTAAVTDCVTLRDYKLEGKKFFSPFKLLKALNFNVCVCKWTLLSLLLLLLRHLGD